MKSQTRRWSEICILSLVVLLHATGCGNIILPTTIEISTEEEEVKTFYGEGRERVYIDNELMEDVSFKEWKGSNRRYRNECTIKYNKDYYENYLEQEITNEKIEDDWVILTEENTFNEGKCIIYWPESDIYNVKEMSFATRVTDNMQRGIDVYLQSGLLKEYIMGCINALEEDYNLSVEDDVRIDNYLTQHIIATPKDEKINERYEWWIHQDTWLPVKIYQITGNLAYEYRYLDFKINPELDESIFAVNIPEGANVQYIYNSLEKVNKEVTLDEAAQYLGGPVFYLDEHYAKLISVEYIEYINQQHGTIKATYETESGSRFVVTSQRLIKAYELLKPSYEKVKIRDREAIYGEIESDKVIEFIEDDMLCDIYTSNSNMSKEELMQLANKLEVKTAN